MTIVSGSVGGEPGRPPTESLPGPSAAGSVVLDIGADVGALVLTAPRT